MISKIIAAIGISLMIYGAPCAFAQGGDHPLPVDVKNVDRHAP
ncbi:hypothetical protein [Roseibium aggregatum]|nr:hypothetical protein [Roseibium aggregatum]